MIDLSIYLCKATDILNDYKWVYNFRATHLFVNEVLSCIPKEWAQTLLSLSDDDLSLLTRGIVKDGWPTCLVDFVLRCHELTLPHTTMECISETKGWDYIPAELQKGMSPKKQHEVLHLASFIYQQCNESNLSRILDLGSGLGYLGKLLHHRSGYRVLGLEADEACVGKAVSMQKPICSLGVRHMALTLKPAHKEEVWKTTLGEVRSALESREYWEGRCLCGGNSSTAVYGEVASSLAAEDQDPEDACESDGVCMVSLHSCGDLSTTALRLFLELPQAKRLVLMSCCYHKMKSVHQVEGKRWRKVSGCCAPEDFRDGEAVREEESLGGEKERPAVVVESEHCGDPPAARVNGTWTPGSMDQVEAERLVSQEDDEEVFPDFPMSSELESLVCARRSFLRRPLLRLASEMTVDMWRFMTVKQRNEHSVHVLGRAIFELYSKRERYKLKKMRRRGVRKTQRSNFDDYLEDALQRFQFIPLPPHHARIRDGVDGGEREGSSCTPAVGSEDPAATDVAASLRTQGLLVDPAPLRPESSFFPSLEGGLCALPSNIPYIDEADDDSGFTSRKVSMEDSAAVGRSDGDDESSSCRRSVDDSEPSSHRSDAAVSSSLRDGAVSEKMSLVVTDTTPVEVHRRKLKTLTEERCTPETLRLTTALYALQAAIQSVAEGIVIADRLAFLLEQGGSSIQASLVRVFDQCISPRGVAIVARKRYCLMDTNNK